MELSSPDNGNIQPRLWNYPAQIMGISSLGSIETHPAQIHFQTLKPPIFRPWKQPFSDTENGKKHFQTLKTAFSDTENGKKQFSGTENTSFQAMKTPIFKHWKHLFSSTENTPF